MVRLDWRAVQQRPVTDLLFVDSPELRIANCGLDCGLKGVILNRIHNPQSAIHNVS
jgi:hypothetical protein